MTRANRKAKPQPDFIKKKRKLGKKALPSNHTNTNLSTRRIHVPNQATATNHQELLSRTRHHNAKTRVTTWNTLTNHVQHPETAPPAPSALLAAAVPAVCDEHPAARAAVYNLLKVLFRTLQPAPFHPVIDAMFHAALTHIRPAIRVDAANALVQFPVRMLGTPPFEPLAAMLATSGKARTAALAAVSALCGEVVPTTAPVADGTAANRRFCYHQQPAAPTRQAARIERVSAEVRRLLVERVSDAVLELLQARGRGVYTACDALAGVVAGVVPDECVAGVKRVLRVWDYTGETYPLVLVALAAGESGIVAEYVRVVLRRDRYVDRFDSVLRMCVHVEDVADAFAGRFRQGVTNADYTFIKKAFVTAVAMLRGPHAGRVVDHVPAAVKFLREGDEEIAKELVAAACYAWRGYSQDARVAEALVGVCVSPLVDDVVNDIIGVALCAGVLTADASVAVLGDCVKRNRGCVVERFLDALEWLASRHDEHKLKALALARALGRVVGQPIVESVSRIEAVV